MTRPLRVLVAHNRYRSELPSGENALVDLEIEGLRDRGVTVDALLADSDDIAGYGLAARLTLPLQPTWSAATRRRFRTMITAARPDVLHLHNPYPLLSPMVVRWAKGAGIPVVQTVYNVRHACLAGTWYRDGRDCRDCAGRAVPLPGVRHGCYRADRAASAALAVAHTTHRSTWHLVDRFLAVSTSVTEALTAAGVPAERVEVRPNGITDPGPPAPLVGHGVLFAGRLSEEKGVALLLEAWRRGTRPRGTTLRLAGDGPLRERVEELAATDPTVTWLGLLGPAAVQAELRAAAVVVVPSLWPEPWPTIALEALAAGRPVVATAVGGLPDMVDSQIGALTGTRPEQLAAGLAEVLADAASRGAAARRRYESSFTPRGSIDRLLAVYAEIAA